MGSGSSFSSFRRVSLFLFFSFFFFSQGLFAGEWIEHKPGGDTSCARGEDFSFFVHEGRTDKVVVDYIGGGACWNAKNCSEEGATFVDNLDSIREIYEKGLHGVYDHDNDENPIKDWTHIVIPYCTGDIHWGQNDKTYTKENGETFTINHRGAINSKAVMAWMKENLPNPEKLFVTGCSAGAYGSVYWLPHLKEAFKDSRVSQFGDSGTGIVTEDFLKQSYKYWKPELNAPTWIPDLDPSKVDWLGMTLTDFYLRVGNYYPKLPMSEFSYSIDENQIFFHELMGGDSRFWPEAMKDSFNFLDKNLENFNPFIAEGDKHCIMPYDEFYEDTNEDGIVFKDWFEDRLAEG